MKPLEGIKVIELAEYVAVPLFGYFDGFKTDSSSLSS